MNFSHSYTKELEHLILNTLLPAYEKYYISKGIRDPLDGLDPKLLRQIKAQKALPALLRNYTLDFKA